MTPEEVVVAYTPAIRSIPIWLGGKGPAAVRRAVTIGSGLILSDRTEGAEEAFVEVRIEVAEIRDLGERIVMTGQLRALGRASGARTESPIGWLLEFRNARIVRMRDFLDPDEALRAAGVPD